MKYLFRENKSYTLRDLVLEMFPARGAVFDDKYDEVVYTGTARAALSIILDFLRMNGQIGDKNTEVLVSRWLCASVYHTMHKVCFPVVTPTKNARGIVVYHQYGFPQNMDEILSVAKLNKWFVIENCVDMYESYYKGRRLGTFGLAAVFSLAKLFPSVQGGALASNNKGLMEYARKAVSHDNDRLIKWMTHLSRVLSEKGGYQFWKMIREMIYGRIESAKKCSFIALNIARREVKAGAMEKRQGNYHQLLDYFKDYDFFQGLERDVVPFVVPLMAKGRVLEKIRQKLLSSQIYTGIYHFDVNRNMLNPKFKQCVWVPVHQGLASSDMQKICTLIRGEL